MLERSLSAETQCPTAQGRAQGAGAPSAQDASSSTTRPPRSCETCPVRLPGFCGRLGGGLQVLAEESKRVDLPAGATVWDEHRGGLVVGILVRGMLRSVYHGQDGRRHVMSLVFPGELIGSHLMRPSLSLEAVLDSRLCRLSGSAYARLAARAPGFRDLIREQTEADLERLRYLTLALGALNPEQRLASFLSLMIKVMPWQPYPSGGGMLTVLLPRADIADLLAISVEFDQPYDAPMGTRRAHPHLRPPPLRDPRPRSARGCRRARQPVSEAVPLRTGRVAPRRVRPFRRRPERGRGVGGTAKGPTLGACPPPAPPRRPRRPKSSRPDRSVG